MSFDGRPGGAKIMGMLVPQSYQKLEAEIIKIRNAKEKNGEIPIISRANFVKIGKSLKCNADKFEDDDLEAATKVLLDTGTILYFEGANDGLNDIIFLSPSWVCKLMAKFITVDCVHAFIRNGILERKNIPLILGRDWGSDNQDTIRKYLRLLWRFQVACEIDDHRILVPSKLSIISPKHTFDSSSLLTRYYFFNCVPYGFWARFITRFLLITKEMLSNPKTELKPKVLSVENVQKNNCDSVLCEEFLNTNGTQSLDQDHTFSSESKTNCFFINNCFEKSSLERNCMSNSDSLKDLKDCNSHSEVHINKGYVNSPLSYVGASNQLFTASMTCKTNIEQGCKDFYKSNGDFSKMNDKDNFPIVENCPTPSLHYLENDVLNVLQELVDCVILKFKANTSDGVAEKDNLTFSFNADNEVNQNDSKNIDFTDSLNATTEFISKQDHEKNQSEEDDEVNAQFIKELSNNDEEYEEYFNDCNELAYLLDKGYLSCWNKGIIFNHPQLYFSIQQLHSTVKPDQETIEIRVSKSPLGYRVLGYIVDHIRTLLEEWYEGLLYSGTVVSSLACPVCTSLGLNQPYTFNISTAFEKIYKSSEENVCKVMCEQLHNPRTVNIEEFCPDLTFQDLPKTMKFTSNDFQCEQNEKYKLGEGQYGKVYSGKCKNKINSAIKFYELNMVNSDVLLSSLNQFYNIRQEVIMLSKLRHHPYIIQFLGFSLKPELCVVMERASRGSLSSVIHKKREVIPRIVKFRICQQIASAIAFMHKKYIIHRDIKSDNILLFSLNHNAKINIKLTDFGTANFMSPSGMKTLYGTKGYTAPEMILYRSSLDEYNSSVDIYSFGIVIYELIAYKRPFHDVSEAYEIDQNVKMGFRPVFYDIPHAFYGLVHLTKLMILLWHQEPSKRPQAKDALSVLLSPTFQLVFGLKTLSSIHNPRELCYVEKYNQIWIACDDKDDQGMFVIIQGCS
ncbi:leucine-rich repeat serine/threonine-protein kinase 2-like [Hydra vulgaris]|uniref:Leucine-rich repeat serine/threonine-protein kinase 2-like n=1 Tax=Hydra vulgaris TaxID=6087 RepID=A0ABM4CA30_HYDVU